MKPVFAQMFNKSGSSLPRTLKRQPSPPHSNLLRMTVTMKVNTYRINDERVLRNVLWADTTLGTLTALVGLTFAPRLSPLLGLSLSLIVTVSLATLIYGVAAFALALQKPLSASLVRLLVAANWLWTAVSAVLLVLHATTVTVLGLAFLALQILAVGGLAYLEGRQVR